MATADTDKIIGVGDAEKARESLELTNLIQHVRDGLKNTFSATERERGIMEIVGSLKGCETPSEAFAKSREGVNRFLDLGQMIPLIASRHPEYREGHKETLAAIATAVEINDFDVLHFARAGKEYGLALEIAAEKNQLTAEVIQRYFKWLEGNPSESDLEAGEKKAVESFLGMIGTMDQMYIKWRSEIYPPAFLSELKNAEDPKEFLRERGLDDPYAVVREEGGKRVSVPYVLAFPEEYQALSAQISKLIGELQAMGNGLEKKGIDRERTVAYLQAYQKALDCQESRKEGDEWESVALWKEVDRRWLECEDRLQFIHGIETGYEVSVDPAEIKVIPELKILMRNDISPNTTKLMEEMRVGNARTLKDLLHGRPEALKSLRSYDRSHVGSYTVISGGGNSMDGLGVAQVGPNYDDVSREHGLKSYVSKEDLFSTEELRDAISGYVFGAEANERDLAFLSDEGSKDHYMVQSIASHELGHMFLGNSSIPKIEEAKATWAGMVAMDEREKRGELPAGTSAKMIKGQVKYCLKYLGGEEDDADDYRNEGIMNMKIFLEVGLVKNENGDWQFDPSKVSEAYARIREVWLHLTDSYVKAERDGEDSEAAKAHEAKVAEWINWTPEIKKLREIVNQGIDGYSQRNQ